MRADSEVGTYYIPKGSSRTLRFLQLRYGQEAGREYWTDDNGTLLALVTISEADTDGPLLLKQHGANRLIRDLIVAVETDAWDPSEQPVKVGRTEGGQYNYEVLRGD